MRVLAALILVLACLASACVADGESGIHRMVIGEQALVVADDVQLTKNADGVVGSASTSPDGKYVCALTTDDPDEPKTLRLVLVRVSGGSPVALITTTGAVLDNEPTTPGEYVLPSDQFAWSPDSKLIACSVERLTVGPDASSAVSSVMVFTVTGSKRAVFDLPRGVSAYGRLMWSPDGRGLVCSASGMVTESGSAPTWKQGIFLCDLTRGSVSELTTCEKGAVAPVRWSDGGRALLYTLSVPKGGVQLREVRLDGSGDTLVQNEYSLTGVSPDGKMCVKTKVGLTVDDVTTGDTIPVLKEFKGTFPEWTPDGRMLTYQKLEAVWDGNNKRREEYASIWLANLATGPLNHMCVVRDADQDQSPSFSSDCLKMSYVIQGRLHVAELAWRDLTADEKIAAGIPLSEDEEKQMLAMNAKQIGTALAMYSSDNNDSYPSDDYLNALSAYCPNRDIFCRPGQNTPIFQYYPLGRLADITYPATAMTGMFDVGYGWQVILYADGHVAVVPKQ